MFLTGWTGSGNFRCLPSGKPQQGRLAFTKIGVGISTYLYHINHVAEILTKKRETKFPDIGRNVMVQCEGYRGLAHRNGAGQWKTAVGNKPLPKFVIVLRFN
jgi:hypothetical protein